MYTVDYHENWDKHFVNLNQDIQKRIWKKIQQIENGLPGRHLEHGLPFFVEEVGQYRICYTQDETIKITRDSLSRLNSLRKDKRVLGGKRFINLTCIIISVKWCYHGKCNLRCKS